MKKKYLFIVIVGLLVIPFRYFYMSITAYFYTNKNPNYDFLRKYFWFQSFHNEDLLSKSS
mgnify:CR=1 FL=1